MNYTDNLAYRCCATGEVENPRKTYPIAILVLMPIVILGDAIPTAISLSLDSDRSHYDVGYFNEVLPSSFLPGSRQYFFMEFAYRLLQVAPADSTILQCNR